jgi:hypothetical protein
MIEFSMTAKIEFSISTYRYPEHLMTMLSCLCSQTSPNWKAHVLTESIYPGYFKVKGYFDGHPQIRFTEMNGPFNDWGHTQRVEGMHQALEEWVVMAGDDNYYTPIFVERVLGQVDAHTNFIYTDLLHNDVTDYGYMESHPRVAQIDIGNFAARTILAKTVPFNKTIYDGDGWYVESFVQKYCTYPGSMKKINKALYTHN